MSGLISAHSAILKSSKGSPVGVFELWICKRDGSASTRLVKLSADLGAILWAFKERIIREPRALLGVGGGLRKDGSSGERMHVLHADDGLRQ